MPTAVKSVLPVVLLGCGGVGRYLLRHIVSCRPLHANQGVAIRVVGVADSSSLLVADDVNSSGLDDALLTHLCAAKSAGSPLSSLLSQGNYQLFRNPEARSKVIDAATTLGRTTGLVLVDCSATYDTVNLMKDAVGHGCCIVLANKKPLTGAYEDFQKLVSNFRQIRFESTVGAGLPVIASVTRIIASGDPISRIVGSLSGTLGYVMSELEDGKRFSEVVKTAKSLGFTEPDPRDDLGGMDVARKVAETGNRDELHGSHTGTRICVHSLPPGNMQMQPLHFLQYCGSCNRALGPEADIYIYKGESAFCSPECREKGMMVDHAQRNPS
ncbi:bifunctional aspartokinase/homoserine dehydrogenase 2, chloroplastic-like isoform X3 [Panicum virgatum]|uniref:bifunctional aspartokinase/homoserine dehydrogenase 2, chloroplastic-like isoform X3 n=1 Tax=Panicum virgatum TaxID=38727 RepID=UPI0019D644B8|nr:bifunctional aspartokinase/homoserine dehydrogenase 2, chloroplastic-like isoform X3 [Panicum virgatum]